MIKMISYLIQAPETMFHQSTRPPPTRPNSPLFMLSSCYVDISSWNLVHGNGRACDTHLPDTMLHIALLPHPPSGHEVSTIPQKSHLLADLPILIKPIRLTRSFISGAQEFPGSGSEGWGSVCVRGSWCCLEEQLQDNPELVAAGRA